jgi:hypothetical protein
MLYDRLDTATIGRRNVLCTWLFIGSNAYDEYTYVPWLNRNVYRRTVPLASITLQ